MIFATHASAPFFDRAEGALKNIPFCLDITSEEYRHLWPQGYEPWCAELEVFHNPFAAIPLPMDMLPGATHWFEEDNDLICRSDYETLILWSKTIITQTNQRAPTLADFQRNAGEADRDS